MLEKYIEKTSKIFTANFLDFIVIPLGKYLALWSDHWLPLRLSLPPALASGSSPMLICLLVFMFYAIFRLFSSASLGLGLSPLPPLHSSTCTDSYSSNLKLHPNHETYRPGSIYPSEKWHSAGAFNYLNYYELTKAVSAAKKLDSEMLNNLFKISS